jgi:hypothetical protein
MDVRFGPAANEGRLALVTRHVGWGLALEERLTLASDVCCVLRRMGHCRDIHNARAVRARVETLNGVDDVLT